MITIRTLEDIKRLIDTGIEEGPSLDYKRGLGNNREVSKDVCAFANSEGGTLIYGIDTKDRIPIGFSWVEGDNIEERIQSVVVTSIHPKLEGIGVFRFPNPTNARQAVFVVEVPRSLNGPHMSDYRYYKRQGSMSLPIGHDEVKNAMFGKGRNAALRIEISSNLGLIDRTYTMIDRVSFVSPKRRRRIAIVPFHTDAWNAVIASGLLFAFSEEAVRQLVDAYAIIHEVNSLIDWLKVEAEPIVHTSAYEDSFKEHGTYIPSIIQNKLGKLRNLLKKISDDLV